MEKEKGQALILSAFVAGVMLTLMIYLVFNAGGWYRDTRQISQSIHRAARDGTFALEFHDTMNLNPANGYLPATPADNSQCLDIAGAKTEARASLARNLAFYESHFDGVTAEEIANDESGTYLVIAAGNPAGLGCAAPGNAHPLGEIYSHPWVYIKVSVPVKALLGDYLVNWKTETTVTSATDTQGG